MRLKFGADPTHHVDRHRLQRFEQFTDIATLVGVVGLGLAMVFGLLTASGNVTW